MFKDPTNGNYYTQSLFLELCYHSPENAIYTLKDEDYEYKGKMYISAKRLYLEIADPTEYEFAKQCFYNWAHWQRICDKTGNMQPHIQAWRSELEVMLRSKGIKGVVAEATSGGKGALAASKWLADKGWADKRKAGRPTNDEVDGERKHMAIVKENVQHDLDRIKNVH